MVVGHPGEVHPEVGKVVAEAVLAREDGGSGGRSGDGVLTPDAGAGTSSGNSSGNSTKATRAVTPEGSRGINIKGDITQVFHCSQVRSGDLKRKFTGYKCINQSSF